MPFERCDFVEYKRFTEEQKEKARNADIINFLGSYMGFEFKQAGKYYQCKQHNSLVVYPNRKGFVWNSRNISGGDCIDFLNKVEGKNFFEAIETIIGENASVTYQPAPQYKSEKSQLDLPEPTTEKYSRVFAYLSQTRGISASVISDFIKSKQIYQDTRGNCVFVGRDENGVERFGCIRGTLTEKKYRGDCKNSDKRYAFRQIGEDTTRIYIFEAPIDLLSHCTMTDNVFGTGAYKKQTRITLGGTSDVALDAFLEQHKEVRVLNFRLDNDEAGRAAVKKYKEKYLALGYQVNAVFSKNKDVNEDLIKKENRNLYANANNQTSRPKR